MMEIEMNSYLPDDILVKVDRAGMHNSLETRAPFLDKRIVEFAYQLPIGMKFKEGNPKWLLKQLLYQQVPQAMVDRPKKGFGVPLADWLRGGLKEWADDFLSPESLKSHNLFNYEIIRDLWKNHLDKKGDFSVRLWNILMFQAWYKAWQ